MVYCSIVICILYLIGSANSLFAYPAFEYPVPKGDYIIFKHGKFLEDPYYINHLGEDINPKQPYKEFEGFPIKAIYGGKIVLYKSITGYGELAAVVEHDLGEEVEFINGDGEITKTKYILSIYGHIRKNKERGDGNPLLWKVNDIIKKGEVIGYINDSSHPDGGIPDHNGEELEHLHLGIRLSNMAEAKQREIDELGSSGRWLRGRDEGGKFAKDFAAFSKIVFSDERLIKSINLPSVYWLQNGKAYHVLYNPPSDPNFNTISKMSDLPGWGWDKIYVYPESSILEVISQSPADFFTTTGSESDDLLIKLPNDPKVYVIKNGERRWITTEATFKALGYNSDDIIIVTQAILDFIPPGDSITINIDVALIIDSSGSMSWNDPKNLRKEAAEIFVGVAQNEDQIAIIDFDNYMKTLWHLQPLTENRDGIIAAINSIDSSGGTNIGRGLLGGYYELLSSSEPNSRAAVLLTDGDGSYYGEAELFKTEGWPIHTVGLGSSVNSALLNNIADETGGIYFALSDANQLKNVYFEIATHITGGTSIFGKTLYMLTGDFYELLVNVPSYQQMVTFLISWPGSDVSTTLVTPSGRQITPDTIDTDVYHAKGLTYELYRINNPEPGEWAVGLTGVDLSPGGEEVSVSASSVGLAAPVDTTPPIISISNPVNGKTYFDQLPTNFNFMIEDPESAIVSQSALLNGVPINNNDSILLVQLGENTLTITATNEANLTSELSIIFFVSHFAWLPPIQYENGSATQTLTYIAQANSTLPIKFAIFNADGSFIADTSVKVIVEGTTAQFLNGEGDTNIRINQEEGEDPLYIVNLHTNFNKCDYGLEAGNEYNLTVYFNDILAARTKLRIK